VDEVLVVDDGSTDDTVEVATAAGAAGVSHVVNKGYGAAIRSCFNYAKENNFDVMVILFYHCTENKWSRCCDWFEVSYKKQNDT
jgi:glycosyltransferase involved in cell wall biosynthesis